MAEMSPVQVARDIKYMDWKRFRNLRVPENHPCCAPTVPVIRKARKVLRVRHYCATVAEYSAQRNTSLR